MDLQPAGVWHFYDGRAGMEPRICELREDFALRKIPTASFAANSLYLEIVRLAYNLVTAFSTQLSGGILAESHTPEIKVQSCFFRRANSPDPTTARFSALTNPRSSATSPATSSEESTD
jgi:hypothetical protein